MRTTLRTWGVPLVCLAMSLGARAEVAVVLNSGEGTVSVIDKATYKEIKRLPVGKEPHHLYPTPDDQSIIVANAASNDLVFLDPRTGEVQRRLANISDPYQLGFSPDRKWFVSVSLRLDRVDLYDGEFKLIKRIPLGKTPSHVWFDAASRFAFITMQESDEIAAIDLSTQALAWKMPIGRQPAGIWMTPDDKHLLVGIMGEDYVAVIDWRAKKEVARVKTGAGAHNFASLGDGKHVFVSNRVANTITKVDHQALKAVESFGVLGGPDCMEVSRDGKELWTTSRWARQVSVLDLDAKKLKQAIPVGKSPHGIYFLSHASRR